MQPVAGKARSYRAYALHQFLTETWRITDRPAQFFSMTTLMLTIKGGNGMPMVSRGADLRKGRYSEPGRIYLLTCVVHGRRPLFSDFWTGRLLVAQLRQAEQAGYVASLAWGVMPDHFHWLIELKTGDLGGLMRRVKACSSRAIVAAGYGRPRIWQKGFHDRALRYEEDIRPAARYIVANPVRAGLVQRARDYSLWDAIWL